MGKPRIVIADLDYNYIIPLQIKFAETFFDRIELEIITQEAYWSEFLSAPQEAAILILSEELYRPDVQRHNIKNVFVLVEDPASVSNTSYGITRLLKYSNLKELFNVITGKSADALAGGENQKKSSQIIVVCSAHGGAGKTTVATGISCCLAQSYKKVLYINADRLQNFQVYMSDRTPISSQEVYARLSGQAQNMFDDIQNVVRRENFYYIPPFRAALMSLGIQFKVFAMLADSAKKTNQYDYIIVDANTGFDENFAMLLKIADKVMVVTENSDASVFATNSFVSNINGINSDKYLFVCNKFDPEHDKAEGTQPKKYKINEYVHYFDVNSRRNISDFSKDNGLQKAAFLLV